MMQERSLGLDPETMRRIGYRTVDMLVNRMSVRKDLNSGIDTSPERLARLFEDPPEQGQDFDAIVSLLEEDVLPAFLPCDHPSFFAFIPGSSTWPGALADFMASALNVHATSWLETPGPSQIELVVLDWFKSWIGYPPSSSGVLVSGGSAANMTALACAREALLGVMTDKAVVYVSDQAHSSMARAARILGFHPDQVPAHRRRLSPAAGCAQRSHGLTCRRRPPAPVRGRKRWVNQHRSRRSTPADRSSLP